MPARSRLPAPDHQSPDSSLKPYNSTDTGWSSLWLRSAPWSFRTSEGNREAVPEVDPEDLKALWREQQKIQAMHPGQHATGIDVMKAVCKPGANVEAVWYRMSMFWLLTMAATEQTSPWMKDGEPAEIVFRTIAAIPMQWIGHTQRQGPPFDVEEFFRRLEAGTQRG